MIKLIMNIAPLFVITVVRLLSFLIQFFITKSLSQKIEVHFLCRFFSGSYLSFRFKFENVLDHYKKDTFFEQI